jgi:eukaryotic-like serine/threonine-protein kinase
VDTPAKRLLGLELADGWKVVRAFPRRPGATGGHFSHGYIVHSDIGRVGFLKALDYSQALGGADPARALQLITEAFNFERDVLERCANRKLDRVVRALSVGMIRVDGEPVQYLIFELADGDARSQANEADRYELAWSLRALHHVATGLSQLHRESIAHQDLKPSNVLSFEGGRVMKVADLGRAAFKGHLPPHEDDGVAGDTTYAPPELLYGRVDPEWNRRRFGCDAYLMGSMVVFFMMGVGMTPLLRTELRDAHAWGYWTGTYEEVLPYVRDAFDRAMRRFADATDPAIRQKLETIVRELCEPDPTLRGHPRNRATRGNQYSLERYVAAFDLLALRVMLGAKATIN